MNHPSTRLVGSRPGRLVLFLAILALCVTAADAVRPGRIEFTDRASFGQAHIEGLEVSPEGRLRPGLSSSGRRVDAEYAWCVLPVGPNIYVGAGDGARIFRYRAIDPLVESIDRNDTGLLAWSGRGLEVYTLAQDDAGHIVAGVSPVGQVHIFQPTPAGLSLIETIRVPDSYVWRVLPVGEDIWIATGSGLPGKGGTVYRWRKDRLRRVWRGTDPHVLSLARSGNVIYAGTQGREGLVLRFDDIESARVRTTVAWDPAQNEVIDLAPAPDGAVFVCATTSPGRASRPSPSSPPPSASGPDEEGGGEGEEGEGAEEEPTPSPAPTGGTVIARIAPDGRVDEWVRARAAVRSLGFRNGQLLAGTTERGQVYRIDGPSRTSLVLDVDEKSILDVVEDWVSTTGPARLYRLSTAAETALCRTEALDASGPSTWGVVTWEASGQWEARTRSGNTREPNGTWSAWSVPQTASGERITSPSGRFIQVEFKRVSRDPADWLRVPSVTWLAANRGPRVGGVNVSPLSTDQRVLSRLSRAGPLGQVILQLSQAARNLANNAASRQAPTLEEILQPFLGFVQVGWTADDPDGDRLAIRVEVMDEAAKTTITVADEIRGDLYLLNTRNFADGRYRIRITVSDTAENNAGQGQTSTQESEVFIIDNTAPVISLSADGDVVSGSATDVLGRITALFVLDADNRWKPLLPVDGISDQSTEEFRVPASPGKSVIVKAVDQAGNVGYGRVTR